MRLLLPCLLLLASLAVVASFGSVEKSTGKRDDPASSWLAYTVSRGNGKRVTYVNATWIVPQNPSNPYGGNAPGWWFGIEPNPASDLIQPILAWGYTSNEFTIFNGYFQWDDGYWWSSTQGQVQPGNTVTAWVKYSPSDNSYNMFIACKETGFSVKSNIPVEQGKLYTDTYFVLEHQPDDCSGYPPNGQVTFTNIHIEIENKPVTPQWTAHTYVPACNSQAVVLSPSSVKFTWNPNGSV